MPVDPAELIDLTSGRVSPAVHTDPEVFATEQERVFGTCWLFLAHESQLPNPGDFFNTYMGLDPVILVRQGDGGFVAFLNACRHRGMKVSRDDSGNARAFSCPYHGWTYDTAGCLVNVPHEKAFNGRLEKSEFGLVRVAQLDSYKGLVFATFDESAPPLDEYLGDMRYYLDASFDRLESGVEVVGGVHKWRIRANWKMAAEQFASDMYHVYTSHISPYMVIAPDLSPELDADPLEGDGEGAMSGRQFSDPSGHGSGWWLSDDSGTGDASIQLPRFRQYLIDRRTEVTARLDQGRALMEAHNTVFPNFSYLYPGLPTMRVWHPRAPGEMEVWSWVFVDADAPPEIKDDARRFIILAFGPSGIFEQDDGDNWATIQQNFAGPQVRRVSLNYQMGLGPSPETNEFPGTTGPVLSDMAARGFYRHWLELMTSEGSAESRRLSLGSHA